MLKIKNQTGKVVAVLKDDATEPEVDQKLLDEMNKLKAKNKEQLLAKALELLEEEEETE